MMESPIDPAINKAVFHTIALGLGGLALFSLLRQRHNDRCGLNPQFKLLEKASTPSDRLRALEQIESAFVGNVRNKLGNAKISIFRHASTVVKHLALEESGSNADEVIVALRIAEKGFTQDDDGKAAFDAAGGCKVLVKTLSTAYSTNQRRVLEQTASLLRALTSYDISEVVLPHDIPRGAACAATLARMPHMIKMLNMLSSQTSAVVLSSITAVFCNVASLNAGAHTLAPGQEGTTGIEYFLGLLNHHNQGVIENAAKTVSSLVSAGVGHDVVSREENIRRVADLISVNMDAKTANAALTIVLRMLSSKHASVFFNNFEHCSNGLSSLFSLWCKGSDPVVRQRAQMLIRALETTTCSDAITKLFDINRSNIMERRNLDEEEKRRLMQRQQQQQMMMQQLMMQNGMAGMPGME